MSKHIEKRVTSKIGIDLAKSSFQLYAEDESGKKVMNRKMSKKKLTEFMSVASLLYSKETLERPPLPNCFDISKPSSLQ